MKKMIVSISCILIVTATFAQFPEFKYYPIGNTSPRTGQSSLVDINKDGHLDWVVGTSDSLWWFEYQSAEKWVKHLMGLTPLTESAGIVVDVNGDGLPDEISGQTWFKNTGDPLKVFTRFLNGAKGANDIAIADIDGDGKQDVVYMNDLDGIIWYKYSDNPEKKWKANKVYEGVRSGIGPMGVGDLNQDGKPDIVRSNLWLENQNNGKDWVVHQNLKLTNPTEKFPNCTMSWIADIDKDGYNDIVQVESYYPNCKVVWLKRMDKKGLTWFMNKIDMDSKQEIHSLIVADFDNDGDLDVFVGGSGSPKDLHVRSFIYENLDGIGKTWKKHEILTDKECYGAQAGDVDGDGDIDIVGKSWNGKENYYLRNMLNESKK
jgi:hypothetical protein